MVAKSFLAAFILLPFITTAQGKHILTVVHTVSSSRQVPVCTNEAYGVCGATTHSEEPEYEVVEID